MIKLPTNLVNCIKNSKVVAIFMHVRPDGDCLGSSSALRIALESLGKKVDVFCATNIHEDFNIIPCVNLINKQKFSNYDLAICVDVPEKNRLGYDLAKFNEIPLSVKLDHHLAGSQDFATYNFSTPVASTSNIIYYLLKQLKVELNSNLACCLYAGISTDTGCFLHKNVTPEEHALAAELLKYDFNYHEINYTMFVKKSEKKVSLIKSLFNNLEYHFNKKLVVSFLTSKDFETANAKSDEETEIIHYLNGIGDSLVTVLITQNTKNKFIISFRSISEKYDVATLASKYFGGGGHTLAAGCTIFGSLTLVKNKILDAIRQEYGWIC